MPFDRLRRIRPISRSSLAHATDHLRSGARRARRTEPCSSGTCPACRCSAPRADLRPLIVGAVPARHARSARRPGGPGAVLGGGRRGDGAGPVPAARRAPRRRGRPHHGRRPRALGALERWSASRPAGGCWRSRCGGRPRATPSSTSSCRPSSGAEPGPGRSAGSTTATGSTGCARWPRRRASGSSSPRRPPRRSTACEARSRSGRRPPDAHGPVRVDGFHFSVRGRNPVPALGDDRVRLEPPGRASCRRPPWRPWPRSPFTKLRMCLFPKHFVYNTDEPERFPFPRTAEGVVRPHPVRPRVLRRGSTSRSGASASSACRRT